MALARRAGGTIALRSPMFDGGTDNATFSAPPVPFSIETAGVEKWRSIAQQRLRNQAHSPVATIGRRAFCQSRSTLHLSA